MTPDEVLMDALDTVDEELVLSVIGGRSADLVGVLLAALTAAGYALVPREPTDEMVLAGWLSGAAIEDAGDAREAYRAMLAAAPK